MVQKANRTSPTRGRPPAFDRDVVISGAVNAFWAKGLNATTLDDLEAATGVDRSTIYNSFGGKAGLFRSATAAYIDQSVDVLFGSLHEGSAGIGDITDFLDRLSEIFTAGMNPPGCLIVNDMTADRTATDRYLECLESGLRLALERAAVLGEVDPTSTVQRCLVLTAAILGINISHHNSESSAHAEALIAALRSEVTSWVTPPPGPSTSGENQHRRSAHP